MKKRKMTFLAALTAGILAVTAGCGSASSDTAESAASSVAAEADSAATAESGTSSENVLSAVSEAESTEDSDLKVFGTDSGAATVDKVTLENASGKDITALSVKDSSMAEFPASLIPDGETFPNGTRAVIIYDTAESQAASSVGSSSDAPIITPQYDIRITFSDSSVETLHGFPFGDITEGKIQYDDSGNLYLTYTSVSQKSEVSTLEAEKAFKEQAAASAQAAAEQKAAEEKAASEQAAQKAASEQAAAEQEAQKAAEQKAAEQAAAQKAAEQKAAEQKAAEQAAAQKAAEQKAAEQAAAQKAAEQKAAEQKAAEEAAARKAEEEAAAQKAAEQQAAAQAAQGCDDQGTPIFN